MELTAEKWDLIRRYHKRGNFISCSVATVGEDGMPNNTPIGSLILRDGCSGFFFDAFPQQLGENLDRNNNICVLFTQSSPWYWLKSMAGGAFQEPSAIKLSGKVGSKRDAEPAEIEAFKDFVKLFRFFKGYNLVWSKILNDGRVRDVQFTEYFSINTGVMSHQL